MCVFEVDSPLIFLLNTPEVFPNIGVYYNNLLLLLLMNQNFFSGIFEQHDFLSFNPIQARGVFRDSQRFLSITLRAFEIFL